MIPSDTSIATAIRDGNETTFETLFRKWYPHLCGFARKFVKDPAEGEELVQELFCHLWDKRTDFHPTTSIKAYLYGAVRNRCFNRLEHLKVREKSQEAVAETLRNQGTQANPTQLLEASETQLRIEAAIGELPERCRQVFELSRYEGLKYNEIAHELNISPKTVEVQIGKALKYLRTALRDILPLVTAFLGVLKEIENYLPPQ